MINGAADARDDVGVPKEITTHLREAYGEPVVEQFRQIADLPEP